MRQKTTDFFTRRSLISSESSSKKERAVRKQKLLIVGVLLLCIIGTFLISQLFLIHASIRLDESQSLWQTSHSLTGTLKVIAEDVHVPLYHLLLHFWQIYIGPDIVSARFLSYIFFVLTIPFVYLLSRKILSVNWSLFAVFLFSFAPFMNWYANEARMYTLLALIATISSYFFIQIVESKGKKGWIGYTLSAMVGIYSHYFFFFSLMAQAVYFLLNRKHFEKGTFKKFVAVAALLLIELLPWLLYFRSLGSASNTSPMLPLPSTVDFFNALSQFSFGFQTDTANTLLVSAWPIVVIVSLLSVKHRHSLSKNAGYVLAAGLLPIVLAFAISYLLTPFFLSRYMTACVIPLVIILVWFVSNFRRTTSIVASTLLVILLIISSLFQYISPATPVKEEFRVAAEYLEAHSRPQDVIVLSAPFTVYPIEYHYKGTTAIRTLPLWDRSKPGPIPAFEPSKLSNQVTQLNSNHQYVYLLLSYDQGYQEDIYQYYEQNFEQVDEKKFSPDLALYVYRVGYANVPSLSK